MPSKSKAQFRFFKAMESNPDLAKRHGLSKETIEEFTDMTPQRFSKLKEKMRAKK